MNIAENLQLLQQTKEDIYQAIIAVGGELEASAPFSAYSAAIMAIPTGGETPPEWVRVIEGGSEYDENSDADVEYYGVYLIDATPGNYTLLASLDGQQIEIPYTISFTETQINVQSSDSNYPLQTDGYGIYDGHNFVKVNTPINDWGDGQYDISADFMLASQDFTLIDQHQGSSVVASEREFYLTVDMDGSIKHVTFNIYLDGVAHPVSFDASTADKTITNIQSELTVSLSSFMSNGRLRLTVNTENLYSGMIAIADVQGNKEGSTVGITRIEA